MPPVHMWIRPETRRLRCKMFIIWLTLLVVVKSCSESEFMLPGSICCHFCTEGRYRAVNCTRNENGLVVSGGCELCTKCADGMEMAPCTYFADTQCTTTESSTVITVTMTMVTPATSAELVITHTALYLLSATLVSIIFIIIIAAAVVYKWCRRRSVTGDPAREPFKIMV